MKGEFRADVAVVGAGVTGLSAALHLAERNINVIVLEANDIGWGGSGRAFGQIVPYTKRSESVALRQFGPERGERLLAAAASAPGLVYGLIEKHCIQCDPLSVGLLFAAHSKKGLRRLERRAAFWQERGAPIAIIGPDETRRMTGSDIYRYALFDKRGGTLNPFAYARGLAKAALACGAAIHIGSPMLSSQRRGGSWVVSTGEGCVVADTLLLTTDSYSGGVVRELPRELIRLRAYQIVTRPLPSEVLATILPGGQSLTDTRRLFSGVRVHPSGRLHVSLDGPVLTARGRPFLESAAARVRKLFPQIEQFEWEETWSGWVGVTLNEFPRLLTLGDGRFAAFGYSGRGLGLGTLLGRDLARHMWGNHPDDLAVPLTPSRPIFAHAAMQPLAGSLVALYRILDAIDERRVSEVQ